VGSRYVAPGRARSAPGRQGAASPREGAPQAFVCGHCGVTVLADAPGTGQRNHCPRCLHSVHLDITVGDRRSSCRGLMEPIALWLRGDGEVSLLHRCRRCGVIRANRLAGDDDEAAVRTLAHRVLSAGG
jgi:hypothetical protein